MEHGIIAQDQRCEQIRWAQQGVNFSKAEHSGQAVANFGAIDICQGIDFQHSVIQKKTEKGPDGRQPTRIGANTDLLLTAVAEVAHHLSSTDSFQVQGLIRCVEKIEKGPQISTVGINRIAG